MADLIVIGYPDEATAEAARDEARRLVRDLIIQPDAIAVIRRMRTASTTSAPAITGGRRGELGMFWGCCADCCSSSGLRDSRGRRAGLGALMVKLTRTGNGSAFQDQVRDLVKPATSALFLLLKKVTPDKAVKATNKFGGTVLNACQSKDAEQELQQALRGHWGSGS
jgi:uncharacterized membrane protein